MGVQKRLFYGCLNIILVLSVLTVPLVAAADEPHITSATIGKQNLITTSEVTVIKDDLTRERKILIGGQSAGGGPPVEKVEVSLNGGQTWKEATGREKWQHEFLPLPNYTYHLTLRVTNADGAVSNPKTFGIKRLTYLPITLSELIEERLDELAKVYMAKDRDRYMGFISRGYQNYPRGWQNLRKAIENDFKSLNNIVLSFSVNQIFELEEMIMADIHWRLTYAGLLEPKEGYVEIHFDRNDQLAILVQKNDLYFGSAPIGYNGTIQIVPLAASVYEFIVTDLDKVGANIITVRVRTVIGGVVIFNGNITLTETPRRSGKFVGSRFFPLTLGDTITITYTDEITADWRRNVRRVTTFTFT
ncbi:MAG: hypothetical protein JXA50_10865 [Deltaproteobacteria bacterium]|nr:hypothetical protein [Deltaproteobacteria bacterium]